jgi:hypothetical protein
VGEGTVNWIEVAFVSMERHDDLCFDLLLNHNVLEELEALPKIKKNKKEMKKWLIETTHHLPGPKA